MAQAPRKRDPNAPPRVIKPREYILMYKGENLEMLGVAGNANEALDKVLSDPTIKIFKFVPPKQPRRGNTKPATA